MNEFLKRLIEARDNISNFAERGVNNIADAGRGIAGRLRQNDQEMLDAERERNLRMINQNFGDSDNYLETLGKNRTSSPTIGPFISRLLGLRNQSDTGPSK
jgi:hypothetical protein